MNFSTTARKPKQHFETRADAASVTFDDGHSTRRNFPWHHFCEARIDYMEMNFIKVTLGEWIVTLRGKNLEPLFEVIESQTLSRIRAQPNLANERERENDSFVVEIAFKPAPRVPQMMGGSPAGLNLAA